MSWTIFKAHTHTLVYAHVQIRMHTASCDATYPQRCGGSWIQFKGEEQGAVVAYFQINYALVLWFLAADSHGLKNILNVIFFGLKKQFHILSGYMS